MGDLLLGIILEFKDDGVNVIVLHASPGNFKLFQGSSPGIGLPVSAG
mgnify:CR=1 FL=1